MAQQGAQPGMVANPAAPTGPTTGSPWEQNMMARLGPSANPEDLALRQKLYQTQMQAGQGPQYQGLGRPGWQTASPTESLNRANTMSGGALIQNMGDAMGKSIPGSPGPNQAAMKSGYYASQPGAMGQAWRANPVPIEQSRWMARG